MKQLVTFTPDNRYFFGDSHGYEDSYIISSKLIPPISTVFGTLRKSILVQNGALELFRNSSGEIIEKAKNDDPLEIQTEIGDFDYNVNPNGNLGKLNSVSPLFIKRISDGMCFYPIPINWQIDGKHVVRRSITLKKGLINNFNGSKSADFYQLDGYSAKLEISNIWVDMNNWCDLVRGSCPQYPIGNDCLIDNDIFVNHKHPGIGRNISQENSRRSFTQSVSDQSFFQKEDYSFKDAAFCFAMIVDVEGCSLKDSGVFMGGDRSFFIMKATEYNNSFSNELIKNLLSPKSCLEKDGKYVVLSEINICSTSDKAWYCLNGGNLNKQRRLVLSKYQKQSDGSPFRMRLKGAVTRSIPIGSIIITTSEIQLKPGFNQNAGFDRLIKL